MRTFVALLLVLLFNQLQAKTPQRIVTLSPHAAELIDYAGAADRLIGVSAFSDFPAAVKALPLVGDANGFDRERLLALQPDLVIAWQQSLDSSDIAWLQSQSFQLFLSDPLSLQAIMTEIKELGEILNTQASAQVSLLKIAKARLELITIAAARSHRASVIHQLWNSPLIALTDQSMVSAVLSLCGIETPVHVDNKLSATLSKEQMYLFKIDAIVVDDKGEVEAVNPNGVAVIKIDTSKLHRASPRMLESAVELCRKLP